MGEDKDSPMKGGTNMSVISIFVFSPHALPCSPKASSYL